MERRPPFRSALAPQTGTAQLPFLRIYRGPEFVRSFQIAAGTHIAGRDPEVGIHLEDPFISRRHFQLEHEGEGRLFLQDLGSANGTFVNGKKVVREALAHGDEIQVGELRMVVHHHAAVRSNVIPFPDVNTAPHAQVVERVAPPLRLGKWIWVILLVGSAGGAGWLLNRWLPPILPSRTPISEESVPRPKPSSKNLVSRFFEKQRERQGRKETARKAAPVGKPRAPTPTEEGELFMERVGRSLDGVEEKGLGRADQLRATPTAGRQSNVKRIGEMAGLTPQTMDVEIRLPRMEQVEKTLREEKERVTVKNFDPQAYQAMLRSRIEGVDTCYARHSKTGATGKVSVWFSIGKDGRVVSQGIESSTFKNKAMHDCILGKISQLRADPPPWDRFTVSYAFRFGTRQITF